jgi:hypothetical protein
MRPPLSTLTLALLVACEGGAPASPRPASMNPGPDSETPDSGTVEPGLVGIWGEIWSSGQTLEVGVTGETVTVSSGLSAQLKVRANGTYTLEVSTGGYSSSCPSVQLIDRSEGSADFGAGRLVLRPRSRTLDVRACSDSGLRTLSNDPIRFEASISAYRTISAEPSLQAELRGGPYSLTLKRLDPPLEPTANPQPADFVLGEFTGITELFGLWAAPDADLSFYDPTTGRATFIADNLRENRWLRFSDDGTYQLGAQLLDTGGPGGGGCKRDVIYFERGRTQLSILTTGDDARGDVRFDGEAATVVERLRDCGEDDGVRTRALVPGPSYARWELASRIDRLTIGCIFPQSRMQFTTCTNQIGYNTYGRR